ncbi:MAG: hypothetical protein NZM26_00260 [Patescibacteria group bacterium]|nr:hypothetical protein [Patescibacteria group bacterium]
MLGSDLPFISDVESYLPLEYQDFLVEWQKGHLDIQKVSLGSEQGILEVLNIVRGRSNKYPVRANENLKKIAEIIAKEAVKNSDYEYGNEKITKALSQARYPKKVFYYVLQGIYDRESYELMFNYNSDFKKWFVDNLDISEMGVATYEEKIGGCRSAVTVFLWNKTDK